MARQIHWKGQAEHITYIIGFKNYINFDHSSVAFDFKMGGCSLLRKGTNPLTPVLHHISLISLAALASLLPPPSATGAAPLRDTGLLRGER